MECAVDGNQYEKSISALRLGREVTDASYMTTCQVLKALEMDAGKYAAGGYEIKELLYRDYDNRLYHYETDERIEM